VEIVLPRGGVLWWSGVAEEQQDGGVIRYVEIPKRPGSELTWLQRFVTIGKVPKQLEAIAARTVLNF